MNKVYIVFEGRYSKNIVEVFSTLEKAKQFYPYEDNRDYTIKEYKLDKTEGKSVFKYYEIAIDVNTGKEVYSYLYMLPVFKISGGELFCSIQDNPRGEKYIIVSTIFKEDLNKIAAFKRQEYLDLAKSGLSEKDIESRLCNR